MKKTAIRRALTAISPLLACVSSATSLLNEDYEDEAAASYPPYRAAAIRPHINTEQLFLVMVEGHYNSAGTGKAIHLHDTLGGPTDSASLEYDFVASPLDQSSALQIDFDFAKGPLASSQSDRLFFGAGEYEGSNSTTMNGAARRFFQIEFNDDSSIKFKSTSGGDAREEISSSSSNHVTIIVNDYDDQPLSYQHPKTNEATSLAANSVAYYLNGTFILETSLDLEDTTAKGTVGTSANNFGRLGFYSSTKSANNSWIFDNISVKSFN